MAEIEKTEFEFPDEKENPRKGGRVIDTDPQLKIEMEETPDTEIEVVDDTPTESKRHKKYLYTVVVRYVLYHYRSN